MEYIGLSDNRNHLWDGGDGSIYTSKTKEGDKTWLCTLSTARKLYSAFPVLMDYNSSFKERLHRCINGRGESVTLFKSVYNKYVSIE